MAFRKYLPIIYTRVLSTTLDWCHLSLFRRRVIQGLYGGKDFDVVHVVRLYAISTLGALGRTTSNSYLQLDIDDFESDTRFKMAEIQRARGARRMAGAMYLEGTKYSKLERTHLPEH